MTTPSSTDQVLYVAYAEQGNSKVCAKAILELPSIQNTTCLFFRTIPEADIPPQ